MNWGKKLNYKFISRLLTIQPEVSQSSFPSVGFFHSVGSAIGTPSAEVL